MKLFRAVFEPHPQLFLEYMPCGSLAAEYVVADEQQTVVWPSGPYAEDQPAASTYHESSFMRSEAPPPESTSASGARQERAATSKASGKRPAKSKTPSSSSSSARRHTTRRGSRSSRREASPNKQPELASFLEDYSNDPLNSHYVRSRLKIGICSKQGQYEPGR